MLSRCEKKINLNKQNSYGEPKEGIFTRMLFSGIKRNNVIEGTELDVKIAGLF